MKYLGKITDNKDLVTKEYVDDADGALSSAKEDKSNKVTSISSSSTNTQYPSAKATFDKFLSKTENTNVSVIGTTKNTTSMGDKQLVAPNGIVFGGTAASAGLVTRGICGVSTPDAKGACSKENLYINYDGNNNFNASRQMVLNAGNIGTHLGSNMYQYTVPRGEIVKNWVENKITGKEDSSNKKSTIVGNESNTTYYPNTKAVADYSQPKDYIVTLTKTGEEYNPVDYNAMVAAYNAGKNVVLLDGGEALIPMLSPPLNGEWYFGISGYSETLWGMHYSIYSDGSVEVNSEEITKSNSIEDPDPLMDNKFPTNRAVLNFVNNSIEDAEHTSYKVSSWSATTTNTNYPSEKLVKDSLDLKEDLSNKIQSISSSSTATQYPSAKAVYSYAFAKGNKINTINSSSTDSKVPSAKAVYTYSEALANKVSAWSATTDNTHYPSEKLVKDSLDAKANSSDLANKMDKANPTGTGSFSLNRLTDSTVGTNSVTFGTNNAATKKNAFATGEYCEAIGKNSFVSGNSSYTFDDNSMAFGVNSIACGGASFSGGEGSAAIEVGSYAEGINSTATGRGSHAEGGGYGWNFIEEFDKNAKTITVSSASDFQVNDTIVLFNSVFTSNSNKKTNVTITAINSNTLTLNSIPDWISTDVMIIKGNAAGQYAHSEGFCTTANGNYSHSEGQYTIANGDNQTALGKFNVADDTSAIIVGNGSANNARSNAMKMDWNGNVDLAGNINDISIKRISDYITEESGTDSYFWELGLDSGIYKVSSSDQLCMDSAGTQLNDGLLIVGIVEEMNEYSYTFYGDNGAWFTDCYFGAASLTDGMPIIEESRMQSKNNMVTSISSSSTDSKYPSAKAVYDAIQAALIVDTEAAIQ